jgi:hypothetical protein
MSTAGLAAMDAGTQAMLYGIQYETSKKEAKKQRDWAEGMWNKSNLYNSPQAQMQRYREAGLNPNLIYGSGAASSGNATELPSYNRANMQSMSSPSAVGYAQLAQQEPLVKANTKKVLSEIALNELYQISESLDQISKRIANEHDSTQLEILKENKNIMIEQQRQILLNLKSLGENVQAQTGLTNAQIKTEVERPENIRSDTSLNYSGVSKNQQSVKESKEYIKNLRQDREYRYFETQWKKMDITEKHNRILYFLPEELKKLARENNELISRTVKNYVGTASEALGAVISALTKLL